MQDDPDLSPAAPGYTAASNPPPARRRGSARGQLVVALLAFATGGALVIWASIQGYLPRYLGAPAPAVTQTAPRCRARCGGCRQGCGGRPCRGCIISSKR
ncbi:hypothetical protein ACFSTD_16785 [Novosphingobium colocasiae]